MSDSGPPSDELSATAAGVAPPGLETRDADPPMDPVEQAALARARAKLVASDYQPVRLGRFVLLERLGHGGMGVVHAGYDDVLDRRVALKLIGSHRASTDSARRRLFREAQAMAKLSHPNVVQVFEAGEQDGHLFIAMELVEGRTLRAWNREAARTWDEVLRMFVGIGEGLAAAHEAGVVHRDFKPDNVLIGRGDRPKVADFGLATLDLVLSSQSHPGASSSGSSSSRSRVDLDAPLTVTGEVMGTPAYMPPEQFTERRCDAVGDQFSFCVALYESLYGERPFAGENLAEIMAHVKAGDVRPAPARTPVPAWVRAIVVRGLSARRSERFVDMREVIAALGDDPHVRRRRVLLRVLGTTAVVGSVVAGVIVVQTRPRPCADAEDRIADLWNDEVRTRVVDALHATGVSYADDTAARASHGIERWAARWVHGYVDACEATHVRGAQSPAALDLRMGCLDRGRTALGAAIDLLGTADASVVENAVRLVDALPRLDACDDLDALRARVPPPDDPEVATAVDALRDELAVAYALHVAGRIGDAEAAMLDLQARARSLGFRPVQTEIDTALAELFVTLAKHDEAEALFRTALGHAIADGDDASALGSATGLVMLLGAREARFAEAAWIGDIALGLAQRRNAPIATADVHNSLGGLADRQARYDEAETHFRTALELLQGELGESALEVAVVHENLGTTMIGQGRHEDGLAQHRIALSIREGELGPEHPLIAIGHFHVGSSLQELGRYEEAESELRHAIDLLGRTFGPNHPDSAMAYTNLGIVLDELGRHAAAQTEYRRALPIFERAYGPDHPVVAQGYNNLGTSFEDEGRFIEAEAEFRRALVISRRAFGEDHPDVARTLGNLASVLVAQRRWDEAVEAAEASLAISKTILVPEDDLKHAYRVACEAERARADANHDASAATTARVRDLCARSG